MFGRQTAPDYELRLSTQPAAVYAGWMADKAQPTRPADPLPDGKNLADYHGHQKWSSKRWAWEFLRRNPTFIDACDELAAFADAEKKEARRLVALLFGLDRFKPYSEDYGTGKPPKFEAADIYVYCNVDQDEPKTVPLTALAKGEVVIRFNLWPSVADERALRAQLKRAGAELRAKRRSLLSAQSVGSTRPESVSEEGTPPAPIETAGQRHIYIRHLRILDLLRTQSTIVEVLRIIKKDNDTPGHLLRNGGGKADVAMARQYAESKYLVVALGKVKTTRKRKASSQA